VDVRNCLARLYTGKPSQIALSARHSYPHTFPSLRPAKSSANIDRFYPQHKQQFLKRLFLMNRRIVDAIHEEKGKRNDTQEG
jgi:hypothetical protein